MAFFEVREPVMRHELDPICCEHIEERSLLVIAIGILRIARQAVSFLALVGIRLDSREKPAADDLRIRLQK